MRRVSNVREPNGGTGIRKPRGVWRLFRVLSGVLARASGATAGVPGRGLRGFTLLEVLIAVLVIGMLAVTLHRFVSTILTSLRISNERSEERALEEGFFSLVQLQLSSLPAQGPRWFSGQPHVFGGHSNDVMEWECGAGPGVLTSAAGEMYRVSLELKPVSASGTTLELGLRRRPLGDGAGKESWVPLLRPVVSLEIRYFDARRNTKPDKWTDSQSLPALVYLSLQRHEGDAAEEVVLSVPAARVSAVQTGVTAQPGGAGGQP
jgi:prepilin-type N-terminal cleavage/methylation domain-containing protein